jgi:hypothetical protein
MLGLSIFPMSLLSLYNIERDPSHLQVREARLSLLCESGHTLLLIVGSEHAVEEASFEAKTFR